MSTLLFVLNGAMLVLLGLVVIHLKQLQSQPNQDQDLTEKMHALIKDEFQRHRQDGHELASQQRQESHKLFSELTESLLKRMMELSTLQTQQQDSFSKQLHQLTQQNDERSNQLRESVEKRLTVLQADNNQKLEKMRETVDEKLHATLEKRLGESFKLVSDRLEQVHKGLGEMQHLAVGVGDLKKILTNVKTRGVWGEVQLAQLLDQILTPEQYAENVKTKQGSDDMVEFAIKLPGKDANATHVWLPMDAKFPQESYQRLLEAQDRADVAGVEESTKQLEAQIKLSAKTISEKYIDPPHTTDFAILFLPVEGLYAEVLRIPGMIDTCQQKHRVILAGPTTLAALLNSLQMGFRTLAIEKRSSEVWELLSVVKTEFGKFGDILDKTQKKLQEAGNTMETAARKSRTIERKLRQVETDSLVDVMGPMDIQGSLL